MTSATNLLLLALVASFGLPVTAQDCPAVGTGTSCTDEYAPVHCGPNNCEYSNSCNANAAGWVSVSTDCRPAPTTQCGSSLCYDDEFCCNESCSRCVTLGGTCDSTTTCVDRIECGNTYCVNGQECCSPTCGKCVDPGQPCTGEICQECGTTFCAADETCCNASCGTCVPPGGACTQQICVPCGDKLCSDGMECCNDSCGICVSPGVTCNKDACLACGDTRCPQGVACNGNVCAIPELQSTGADSSSAKMSTSCFAGLLMGQLALGL